MNNNNENTIINNNYIPIPSQLRQEYETPEVKAFERRMSDKYGRPMRLADVPIKNFVDVDSKLLETKVASLVMRGATEEAGFWPNLINVVQMQAAKDEVPIISQRDFRVHKGKVPRAGSLQSGGRIRKVELDTTDDDKIRYVLLQIDEEDIKLRRFNYIEQSLTAAGAALARNILQDVMQKYIDKAGNSQALGTDKRFVAIMKAIDLNKDDGFGCSAIIIDNTDFVEAITEETAGGTMPWLQTLQNGTPLGDNFASRFGMADGFVGSIFGRIPVYVVSNYANLSGNILCVDVPSAAVFGWAPGGQIEISQQINKIADLVEAKVQCKYDIATPDDGGGNSNAIARVTGA